MSRWAGRLRRTAIEWKAWPAAEPSSDFTERVAQEMVREVTRRHVVRLAPAGRVHRARIMRPAALVVAACLVGCAAWGLARRAELRRAIRSESPAAVADPATNRRTQEHFVAPSEPVQAPREPALPAAKAKARVAPARPSSSAPLAPIVPRCTCAHADGVCGCLE